MQDKAEQQSESISSQEDLKKEYSRRSEVGGKETGELAEKLKRTEKLITPEEVEKIRGTYRKSRDRNIPKFNFGYERIKYSRREMNQFFNDLKTEMSTLQKLSEIDNSYDRKFVTGRVRDLENMIKEVEPIVEKLEAGYLESERREKELKKERREAEAREKEREKEKITRDLKEQIQICEKSEKDFLGDSTVENVDKLIEDLEDQIRMLGEYESMIGQKVRRPTESGGSYLWGKRLEGKLAKYKNERKEMLTLTPEERKEKILGLIDDGPSDENIAELKVELRTYINNAIAEKCKTKPSLRNDKASLDWEVTKIEREFDKYAIKKMKETGADSCIQLAMSHHGHSFNPEDVKSLYITAGERSRAEIDKPTVPHTPAPSKKEKKDSWVAGQFKKFTGLDKGKMWRGAVDQAERNARGG